MSDTESRCGFVALVGAPNAGKSTLLNRLTGAKISIVTPKAQTTRARVLGIAMHDLAPTAQAAGGTASSHPARAQILFVDTPGIFTPKRRLDRAMVAAAWEGAGSADLTILIADAASGLTAPVREIATRLGGAGRRLALALNKTDLVHRPALLPLAEQFAALAPFEQVFMLSALNGDGTAALLDFCAAAIPPGPHLYPEDELTDLPDRLLAAEIVREQIFLLTRDEVPYGATVETERFTLRKDGSIRIDAMIYVAREGHKAILIGAGGARIREIGARARRELKALLETEVHLFLRVKQRAGWDEEAARLAAIGLNEPGKKT